MRRTAVSAFDWDEFPWRCEYYAQHGQMMPKEGLDRIRHHDTIFLRAVGFAGVPDHVSLWGLLIPIRRGFRQYVNLRPVRLMPGIESPLRNRKTGDIDFYVVRENNEGEYSAVGGIVYEGTDEEVCVQQSTFTLQGYRQNSEIRVRAGAKPTEEAPHFSHQVERHLDHHAVLGQPREGDGRALSRGKTDQYHIDILTAHFVQHPDWFDMVVASNLFGDILSDLGPAVTGTIGIAPSANMNPEKEFPAMFELVHGSAPDIYGKRIANPVGQIWAGAMILDHLGQPDAGGAIVRAIEQVL